MFNTTLHPVLSPPSRTMKASLGTLGHGTKLDPILAASLEKLVGLKFVSCTLHIESANLTLQRFLTTPDATSALLSRPARQDRVKPTVRVELWS